MNLIKKLWDFLKSLFKPKVPVQAKPEHYSVPVPPPAEKPKKKKSKRSGHPLRSHHFGTFSPVKDI